MRWLTRALRNLRAVATRYDPSGPPLAMGRTILALATSSEIIFTSNGALFHGAATVTGGARCDGAKAVALWCASDSMTGGFTLARVVSITLLAIVISGFLPRWTCIPHWYVTFSLATNMTVPNGGDSIGEIVTLLLIPTCLGDDRSWQWRRRRTPVAACWRGGAFAAHLVLRLQVVIVYADAVVSKLTDPAWRHGIAFYFVVNDPQFGLPRTTASLLRPLIDSHWVIAGVTWSVIGIQAAIAAAVIGRRRARLLALALGICLHLAIIVLMGLPSFGLIMMATLTLAYGSGRDSDDWSPVPRWNTISSGHQSLAGEGSRT